MSAVQTSRRSPVKPQAFVRHLVLIALAAVMFYPLLWLVSASTRSDSRVGDANILYKGDFTLSHFAEGWKGIGGVSFGQFILNSFIVASLVVLANLFACSITAYAFARINFRFKNFWFALMLGTLLLPGHVIVIPQYILFRDLGLLNTYWPFVIPKLLATDAFFVFLLVQFFRSIPRELDEAARIDGYGHVGIFLRIILPLSKPALATTAIFSFIYSWNDFFTPLIYLSSPHLYTVPIGLRGFVDTTSSAAFGALFAMSLVSVLPVVGVFIAFQRLLVNGIATTGLRG